MLFHTLFTPADDSSDPCTGLPSGRLEVEAERVGGVGFRLCVQSLGSDPSSLGNDCLSSSVAKPGSLLLEASGRDLVSDGNGEQAVTVRTSTPLIPHLPVLHRVLAHPVDDSVPLEVFRYGVECEPQE